MNSGLVEFRVKNELTQQEMARKIGVTSTFYTKIEQGMRNPSYNFLSKFKKAFKNVDIDEIFFSKELHEMC